MHILNVTRSSLSPKRPRGVLRLALAAGALIFVGIAGATGPASSAGAAVPNADTVTLTVDPGNIRSTQCTLRALVTYGGAPNPSYALPGYEVTFEVVSGSNVGLPLKKKTGQDGYAVISVPRPAAGSQASVIRATLYDWSGIPLVLSNTVSCTPRIGMAASAASAAVPAGIPSNCLPGSQPC